MKKLATLLVAAAFLALVATSAMAAQVRVSQVYGGGGSGTASGATYYQDYVELFNSGATNVDLSGWAVEYSSSSATATWGGTGSTWKTYFVFPQGAMIKACGYLLIGGGGSTANGGGPIVPTPDYTVPSIGDMNMSATSGRIGLFNTLFVGTICTTEDGALVDKVAYGNNNCAEGGTGAAALTNTVASCRNNGGMTDTDNNGADFTSCLPIPHNALSDLNPLCTATPTDAVSWGKIKTIYR